jgi:uridine kinase
MENKVITIAVGGGTSSGKTSIAKKVSKLLGNKKVIVISLDIFYKSVDHLSQDEISKYNFDHPDAFDLDLIMKTLKDLKNRIPTKLPTYDYIQHKRIDNVNQVENVDIIILEGILVLYYPCLLNLFDVKIYVDTASDIRLIRRIERDQKERGRSLESIIHQYKSTVRKSHNTFIEPSKQNADIIIPRGSKNKIGINSIKSLIEDLVR